MSQPGQATAPPGSNNQPLADATGEYPVYNTLSNIVEERLDLDQAQVALGVSLIAIIALNLFLIWIAWKHYSDKIARIYVDDRKENGKDRESGRPKDE